MQSRASFIHLKKQLKCTQNRSIGIQTRRTAYGANKLHSQYARPGTFLSPMAGLHAPRSILRAFIRRFIGAGVHRSVLQCVVATGFTLYKLRIKAMTPRSVEPCASLSQTHAHTHTHTPTHTHAHARTCTHARTCVRTDTHTHAP